MNAPLPNRASLKALAQARLEQTSGAHLCRTSARTFAPDAAHLCSENGGQTCADESALLARCNTACQGLPVSPSALLAELSEADKDAIRSGDPDEIMALRTFAECLAEREKPKLDAAIAKAYRWCQAELARRPEIHRAVCTVDPDGDPVLMAVAVRGVGYVTLKVERANYEGREFELLEMLHRAGVAKFDATKEDTR